ncbi:Na+/H+ antiporter NhaA [Falsirhodobacter algicola]|uniref:Na(+)/H(+) antiporter NhaA n=2 Tax=Falsirhodobacter algicola TaxID=2692330 RepID=A0A8J8SLY1_9RHOB|nr:Na+/H+ antiporter NhaA [Falsirhodobacter algicola]
MVTSSRPGRGNPTFREFINSEASGGIVLMAVAALAILVANSPIAEAYFHGLHAYFGPLSIQHWINDALMAVFFLMVGLEIKREMTDGQLSTWPRRILPGVAALGGMAAPALIYVWFNLGNPAALRGWAIPSATDIAFALGVLSLLGPRVPASLKVFLAALAIIDDLGAVLVIAIFYTADLSLPDLIAAVVVTVILLAMNRKVRVLWPYLVLGVVLWIFVYRSGVHATLAGVVLALTIPITRTPGKPEAKGDVSLLHRLEHALQKPVAFVVVPIFGFANAGVSFAGVTLATLGAPLTMGVAAGLFLGKLIGVFGAVLLMVRTRIVDLPAQASWMQVLGVSLLCGIGFTMSLFIGLLAFADPAMQDQVKIGIIMGSLVSGVAGFAILRFARREAPYRI